MVEQTVGLFLPLPRGPGWRQIDSPSRVGVWSAWITGWITGWHVFLVVMLFLLNRTTDWWHPQHRLGPSLPPHRASIWPWPDTRVIDQVVPGLVSRCRRGGMHATLVSSWYRSEIHGLEGRATSACTICRRSWCGVIKNARAMSVWVMITPGRFTSTDRPSGYIDVVLKYILWSYRGHIGNENRPGRIEFWIDLHGERRYVDRDVCQYVGRYVGRCEKSIRELAKYAPKSARNCHIFQIIDLPYWAIFFCTWQNFRIIWRIQNIMDCLKAISNKDFPQNHKFQQSRQIRLFLITFISFTTTKNRYGPKTK